MLDPKSTAWRKESIADAASHVSTPLRLCFMVLLVILGADQLIAFSLRRESPDLDSPPASPSDVRDRLALLSASPGRPWLLLGDSVLVGDVIAGKDDGWKTHRVIDAMRNQKEPSFPDRFDQIALDGLLPVDAVRVVKELNRIDPSGRVGVVLEINPRYFSRAYASLAGCTRPWIEDLAPPLIAAGRVDRLAWARLNAQLLGDWIGGHLPVYRHVRSLGFDPFAIESALQREKSTSSASPEDLSGRARILEHYREPNLSDESVQVQALRIVRGLCELTGRRVFFFATPLNDEFLKAGLSEAAYGDILARLDGILSGPPNARFLQLDHPLFDSSLFVDHCHMLSEGNRLLGINLLHELNIGLDRVPASTEMVYPEDVDQSLVWNVDNGYREGPGWQALFNRPDGIDIAPDGRVVIADTGNHCLREIAPEGQTVRLLAGTPRKPGYADGPAAKAQLESPASPCAIGDALFFADGRGRRLRRVEAGWVRTEYALGRVSWSDLSTIRRRGDLLYLLDGRRRILEYDPDARTARPVMRCAPERSIRTFDIAPDGRLFAVDEANRIWMGLIENDLVLDQSPIGLELAFPNSGNAILPFAVPFPMEFEKVRFARIVDLRFVERYGGLLVQDDEPPGNAVSKITERIQLRFLDLNDRLVYPWTKTAVHSPPFHQNDPAKVTVTRFHDGSMTLDQRTASLVIAERDRSRIYRIGDGIWGTAKEGNGVWTPNDRGLVLGVHPGTACAVDTLEKFHPDLYLHDRGGRLPRMGPYVGLLLGSSMMETSNLISAGPASASSSSYSLARLIELELRTQFGYRDGIRIDLIKNIYQGLQPDWALAFLRARVENGGRLDFALIDVYGDEIKSIEGWGPRYRAQIFEQFREIADRYETLVVFLDDTGMYSPEGEGLRPPPASVRSFLLEAEKAGFRVIRPSGALVREYLERTPWGSPPHTPRTGHHASPWAIDAAARQISSMLYPMLRVHLSDRVPAIDRPGVPEERVDPSLLIADVFDEAEITEKTVKLVPIEPSAIQSQRQRRQLSVFVDLKSLPAYRPDISPADLDAIAASALHQVIARQRTAAGCTRVSLKMAVFSNYDEYGQGVRENAKVAFERDFDRPAMLEFLKTFKTAAAIPPQ